MKWYDIDLRRCSKRLTSPVDGHRFWAPRYYWEATRRGDGHVFASDWGGFILADTCVSDMVETLSNQHRLGDVDANMQAVG